MDFVIYIISFSPMEQDLLVSGFVIFSVTDTALHKISMIPMLILKTKVGFAICI